jgi:hypothetical protein
MIHTSLMLHILGELPPLEELTAALGKTPTRQGVRGTPLKPGRRATFPQDVWTLHLAKWDGRTATEHALRHAATELERMAPILAALDRTKLDAQLGVVITQFD